MQKKEKITAAEIALTEITSPEDKILIQLLAEIVTEKVSEEKPFIKTSQR